MKNPEYMVALITQHILMIMNSVGRLFSLTMDLLGSFIQHLFVASLSRTRHQVSVLEILSSKAHVFSRPHPCKSQSFGKCQETALQGILQKLNYSS